MDDWLDITSNKNEVVGMRLSIIWVSAVLGCAAFLAHAECDPDRGEALAGVCGGCHGEDGQSVVPLFPKLAGQHPAYITKQLMEFKSQKRLETTMTAMAEPLSDQDMRDLGAFYGRQKGHVETGDRHPLGQKLYNAGNAAAGIPACSGCHGPKGRGNPTAGFPSLSGQHAAYTEKALHHFKAGERQNDMNGMMRAIASKLGDSEMTELAEYISTLQ